jgi:hypothetical protein
MYRYQAGAGQISIMGYRNFMCSGRNACPLEWRRTIISPSRNTKLFSGFELTIRTPFGHVTYF